MKIRSVGWLLLGLAMAASTAVQAQSSPTADRRFYISPMFSYTFADHQRGTGNALGGTIAVGKRITPYLDLELIANLDRYRVNDSDRQRALADQQAAGFPASTQRGAARLYGVGGGFNIYAFSDLDDLMGIHLFSNLYIHGDIMRGQAHDQLGPISDYTSTIYDIGLGYNLPLHITFWNLLGPGLSLRVEGLYRQDQHNHLYVGDGNKRYFQEAIINAGLRIPLGGRPLPPPPPPPKQVKVVPVAQTPPPPPPPKPVCQAPANGQPIDLSGCKVGSTIILHGVNFAFNKSRLTLNAQTILNQVAYALKARTDIKVEIDGYTDGIGSDSYNLKLSQRRADAVKAYLVKQSVDSSRITTKGYGKANPVASNKTSEGRAKNRRVELKVLAESNAAEASSSATPAAPASENTGASAPSAGSAPASGGAPAGAAPAGAAPAGGAPGGGAPAGNAPAGGAPAGGAPAGGAPAGGAPAGGAPAGGAPAGGAPAGGAPAGGAPAGGAPAGGAPAGGAPAGGAPPV